MAGPSSDPVGRLGTLPSVDQLLRAPDAVALLTTHPRWAVVAAVRAGLDRRRQALLDGKSAVEADLETDLDDAVRVLLQPSLRPVLNATGVVLHTNLGRAPLAEAAIERLAATARGYVNLEYDVDERRRGSRHDHVRALLTALTGAEDALVVNNCAAAVMLALGAHAAGRKAVVSRGELVEIGGSFRIPDVMRASGVTLVEVGTTNRTHLADYERALDEDADDVVLVCKVHRSNFAVAGFVAEVAVDELAALAHRRQRLLFVDLGSGALQTPQSLGLDADTPTVPSVVAAGADLVAFSGDKLLGGPQAGILVGTTAAMLPLRSHPLLRAVRPSRLTLAALEATLELYRDDRTDELPAWAMLSTPEPILKARAAALCALVPDARLCRVQSAVGGGALPLCEPPSWAAVIDRDSTAVEARLRAHDPPVIGRLSDGSLMLDVRCLRDEDVVVVARALAQAANPRQPKTKEPSRVGPR